MSETAPPQKQDIDRVLAVLQSIDQSLKGLLYLQQKAAGPVIATDRELDSQYGDPVIKAKDPRDWVGPTMVGKKFSECPADYLDILAERLDYFADRADAEGEKTPAGKPTSAYKRLDAARARGWAKRVREGKVKPVERPAGWAGEPSDDDTSF